MDCNHAPFSWKELCERHRKLKPNDNIGAFVLLVSWLRRGSDESNQHYLWRLKAFLGTYCWSPGNREAINALMLQVAVLTCGGAQIDPVEIYKEHKDFDWQTLTGRALGTDFK